VHKCEVGGSIGYFEARRLWFSGLEVDPQLRLWFISVLSWGRVGEDRGFSW
jgi:hypothetical protein